jgi:hypothetical protein
VPLSSCILCLKAILLGSFEGQEIRFMSNIHECPCLSHYGMPFAFSSEEGTLLSQREGLVNSPKTQSHETDLQQASRTVSSIREIDKISQGQTKSFRFLPNTSEGKKCVFRKKCLSVIYRNSSLWRISPSVSSSKRTPAPSKRTGKDFRDRASRNSDLKISSDGV